MTNEEWLNTLSTEEKAKIIARSCNLCSYDSDNGYCADSLNVCKNGIKEWLKKKHIEPMPELEAGDIVVYGGLSYVAISSTTLVCREMEKQYRLEDINSKIKNIQRYNGSTYQCIWRADNE